MGDPHVGEAHAGKRHWATGVWGMGMMVVNICSAVRHFLRTWEKMFADCIVAPSVASSRGVLGRMQSVGGVCTHRPEVLEGREPSATVMLGTS